MEIVLNERSITVLGRRHTGLDVKKAAVAQGVPISLDSVLRIVKAGPGHSAEVEDSEQIDVEPGARFLAGSPTPG